MPELPEVETVARDLRGRIVGATITDATVLWARTLREGTPEAFADGLAGRRIEAVGRRGKQLVVELSGDAFLTIHLKMTGQLFVVPQGGPPDPYVRVVFELEDGREIRFRDIRKFGRIGLYGADTAESVRRRRARSRCPTRSPSRRSGGGCAARKGRLKPLLLDQTFVAGVGNIYADEALWAAKLHPLRTAADAPAARRAAPLGCDSGGSSREAVIRRGSSIDDYTAPDGDGEMQEHLAVYQRTDEPCLRCGRPIRRIVVGGRATHFCSWCQRLPAADRAGARRILATASSPERRGGRWTELRPGRGASG